MDDCTRTRPRLSPWLDGELGAAEAATVAGHVDACRACAAEVEAWRQIDAVLGHTGPVPDLSLAVLRRLENDRIPPAWWLRIAAAALVATGLGVATGRALAPPAVTADRAPGAPVLEELDRHFGQSAPAGFADLLADLTGPEEG